MFFVGEITGLPCFIVIFKIQELVVEIQSVFCRAVT